MDKKKLKNQIFWIMERKCKTCLKKVAYLTQQNLIDFLWFGRMSSIQWQIRGNKSYEYTGPKSKIIIR